MVEETSVAKKTAHGGKRDRAGRPKSDRDDVSVKVDRKVVAHARYVADLRGITLAEYLTEAVRPIVDRDFAKESRGSGGAARTAE